MTSKRIVFWIALFTVVLSATFDRALGQTIWTAGTSNWNSASNWSLGIPNSASPTALDAVVENGGTAQLLGAPAGSVRRLRIGRAAGGGNLLVDAATLNVTENLHLNETSSGPASVTVQHGATVSSPSTIVGFSSAQSTNFLVTGAGTTVNSPTQFIVANAGPGTATLTVENGAVLNSGAASIAVGAGTTGTATVRNAGSTWASAGAFTVGTSGTGTLNIESQGKVSIDSSLSINGTSSINLNGGTLRFNTISGVNRLNYTAGTIQLVGSRNVSTDPAIASIFGASPTVAAGKELIVEGTASLTQNFANLTVNGGRFKSATYFADAAAAGALVISNGGVVTTTGTASVGINNNNGGVANLSGAGSTWSVGNDLVLGPNSGGLARIFVTDHALLYVGNTLQINNNGDIILEGGTIRFADIINYTKIDWRFGTIQLAGDQFVADTGFASQFLVDGSRVVAGKGLTIEGVATLLETVHLEGGTLSVGQLVNASVLDLQRGTLNVTNQAVTIASGGVFGNTLDVDENVSINVTLGITNQGLVTGDGKIGGSFANAAAGELRAEPGRSLRLTGPSNTNAGQINLFGGMLEFTNDLTNNVGGFISGNGTLKVATILTNQGTMNFSGPANIAGDVTNAAGGKIISAGGGPTTFFDDVINQGEIRTSAGSFTVFFGSVSGAGSFTGTGTVNFEDDLKPGNSPAIVQFGGDVTFGAGATLEIEVGGTTPGTQYDQVHVVGDLMLGGTLAVSLINGFTPAAGQSFNILDWDGTRTGTFNALALPTLAGLAWNTSQLYTLGVLSLAVAAALPGDYNQNGTVDAADYTVWRDHLSSPIALANDDTAGVGPDDYTRWKTHFGNHSGSGSAAQYLDETSTLAIPEPGAIWLAAAALLGAIGARKQSVR